MTERNDTSASPTIVGFDYQYYYFLLQLLNLNHGEKIGYEIDDDVHLEKADGSKVFIQLKHTINDKTNLTERDSDLWKTLFNWINHILSYDEKGKRISELKKIDFVLVTNKNESSQNLLLKKIDQYQEGDVDFEELIKYIEVIYSKTENQTILGYMKAVIDAPMYVLKSFYKLLSFSLSVDDLIVGINDRLKELFVQQKFTNDVFSCLDSNIKKDFYLTTKSKGQNEISFDEFHEKYLNCFKYGRSDKLPIRQFKDVIPGNPLNQTFVKQLIEIGDIDSTEEDLIREYTRLKLLMFNNLKIWNIKGELTTDQNEKFVNNCMTIWRSKFRENHHDNVQELKEGKSVNDIEGKISAAARSCLNDLRSLVLDIEGDLLDYEISNGQFYLLSDLPEIGWHIEWEKRYKNEY